MKYIVRLDNSMITEILFTDALTSVSAVVLWDSISNWHSNKVLTDRCGWTDYLRNQAYYVRDKISYRIYYWYN